MEMGLKGIRSSSTKRKTSDTSRSDVGEAEEMMFLTLQTRFPLVGLHYRRRALNTGYKAGNLEEFARRNRRFGDVGK